MKVAKALLEDQHAVAAAQLTCRARPVAETGLGYHMGASISRGPPKKQKGYDPFFWKPPYRDCNKVHDKSSPYRTLIPI